MTLYIYSYYYILKLLIWNRSRNTRFIPLPTPDAYHDYFAGSMQCIFLLTLELLPVTLEGTLSLIGSVPAVLLAIADVLLVDTEVLPPAQVRGRPRARNPLDRC